MSIGADTAENGTHLQALNTFFEIWQCFEKNNYWHTFTALLAASAAGSCGAGEGAGRGLHPDHLLRDRELVQCGCVPTDPRNDLRRVGQEFHFRMAGRIGRVFRGSLRRTSGRMDVRKPVRVQCA